MQKNLLKYLCFIFVLSLMLLIYSCGGGGSSSAVGGGAGAGGAVLGGAAAASGNPAADNVTVNDEELDNASVVYSDGFTEMLDENCAYTYTNGGLLVCLPIDNASKEEITASDVSDNETINDIADTIDSDKPATKPYFFGVQSLGKPVKKPICNLGKTICGLFDLKGNYPDMTVAITPYLSLLAVPNQGKEALSSGYVPVTGYSADIAVFKTNGKRYGIDEISKVLADKGVTVKVYFVLPYKSTLATTFTSSKYKLYKVVISNGKPTVVDTGKNIKVVEKGTDNVTFEAMLDGFYPFILAREMNPSLKTIDNGTVSGLKAAAITLLACDNESTSTNLKQCSAIAYNTIDSTGAYTLTYEKETGKKLFAEVVSSYLTNKKKVLPYEDLNGYDFSEVKSASYPSVDNLTDADKAYLKDGLSFNNSGASNIKDLLYPENINYSDNSTTQSYISSIITAFMNGETYSQESGEYYSGYNNSYKCTYSVKGDNTTFTITNSCVNVQSSSGGAVSVGVSKSSESTYSYTTSRTLTMKRASGYFQCSMSDKHGYVSSYNYTGSDNKTYTDSFSEDETKAFNWKLSSDNGTRIAYDGTGSFNEAYTSVHSGATSTYKGTTSYNLKRIGNVYYLFGTSTSNDVTPNYSISDKASWSNQYLHTPSDKSVAELAYQLKAKFYDINFTCAKSKVSITDKDIFNIHQDSDGNFIINGGKFDYANAPYLYSTCGNSSAFQ